MIPVLLIDITTAQNKTIVPDYRNTINDLFNPQTKTNSTSRLSAQLKSQTLVPESNVLGVNEFQGRLAQSTIPRSQTIFACFTNTTVTDERSQQQVQLTANQVANIAIQQIRQNYQGSQDFQVAVLNIAGYLRGITTTTRAENPRVKQDFQNFQKECAATVRQGNKATAVRIKITDKGNGLEI